MVIFCHRKLPSLLFSKALGPVGLNCISSIQSFVECTSDYTILLLYADENLCKEANCEQSCVEEDGKAQCGCNAGLKLAEDGKSCEGMKCTAYLIVICYDSCNY